MRVMESFTTDFTIAKRCTLRNVEICSVDVIIQTWISADELPNERLGFLQRPLDTNLNRVNTIIWHN